MNDLEQILDDCLEQIASGASSLEGCLIRYPEVAAELEPLLRSAAGLGYERGIRPSPTFKARTRAELVRHMQAHPRSGTAGPSSSTAWPAWHITLSLTMLLLFLLVSGTVHAQSAIPGDAFYSWKLASEQVWRAVSRDRLGIDLVLAGRRMNEYLSVANDPGRSNRALRGYGEVLLRLRSESDHLTRGRIVPVLQDHSRSLKDKGTIIPQLDDLIREQTGAVISPASSPGGPGLKDAAHRSGTGSSQRRLPDPPGRP